MVKLFNTIKTNSFSFIDKFVLTVNCIRILMLNTSQYFIHFCNDMTGLDKTARHLYLYNRDTYNIFHKKGKGIYMLWRVMK